MLRLIPRQRIHTNRSIRKIADERSEYDRLKALADEQIAAINEKVAAARKRMENGTSYLTSCLADFFATVPHKETKIFEIDGQTYADASLTRIPPHVDRPRCV